MNIEQARSELGDEAADLMSEVEERAARVTDYLLEYGDIDAEDVA